MVITYVKEGIYGYYICYKVNSVFSIFSDILLYVDGRFEYVVCLYLYHLSYHNYSTFSVIT